MFGWLARWLGVGAPNTPQRLRAQYYPVGAEEQRFELARELEHRLHEQAHDAEPGQRRRAAEQLGAVSAPWACDLLLLLLKDMFAEVRTAAREALRRQGVAAVVVLVKALEDSDPRVAVPAAEVLAEIKDPYAVRPLLLVMKFGSVEVRAAAIRALIRYGAAAVPALEAAIADPDPWTRMRGEEILADIRAAQPAAPVAAPATEAPAAPPPASPSS